MGSIMYGMLFTCPDLAFPKQKLSQFSSNPANAHFQARKRAMQYLQGTQKQLAPSTTEKSRVQSGVLRCGLCDEQRQKTDFWIPFLSFLSHSPHLLEMGFSLFLVICFVLVVLHLVPQLFYCFTWICHASEIWVYGSEAGTHEDTTGSRADQVIDINAILKVYGKFVKVIVRKHSWNKEIPDVFDSASGPRAPNEYRIKLNLTVGTRNKIKQDFPNVTFAKGLFGRASTSAAVHSSAWIEFEIKWILHHISTVFKSPL